MRDEHRQDRQEDLALHEREGRLGRIAATIREMQKDISRIDKAPAVLTHSIEGDGVPGLADNIKEVILEIASVKADLIIRIEAVRADVKMEIAPLKTAVATIAAAPGIRAASMLSRVLWIVVPVVVVGILSLVVYGIIRWLEGIPTIGNK